MTRIAHPLLGLVASAAAWRALEQPWLGANIQDPWAVAAIQVSIPLTIAVGTALALLAARLGNDPSRAFRLDVASILAVFGGIFVLALGDLPRDLVGMVFVLMIAVRLAPATWWTVRYGAPPIFILALCLAFYVPLAGWRAAASLPFGDQVFYLLSADRLAHGSLDATIDPDAFQQLLGVAPQAIDATTHVAELSAGARLVQGYALPALITPGWVVGGEVGAGLVIALFAAWTAMQTWILLGETVNDARVARLTWALVTFCAPLALLATHIYPNAVGAALIVTGYRYGFTARVRRPALAGALLGATAFLNPRDGLVLVAVAPFVLAWVRTERMRFVAGAVALVVLAAIANVVTFGIPVPYAGYLYGTSAAQTIQPEPTWNFRFWVGLPAILFDRVFGIAGTAPWLLLAALGVAPAIRAARARLLPAAVAIGASLLLLSLFRLWEGGYAPPNRYVVDVLPLAAPFVALGLAAARGVLVRAFAGVVIATSALMTLLLLAVPSAALNTAFEDKPQSLLTAVLGVDPLGWLPSFQPLTPDWWVDAYLRLIPAVAIVALLVWSGAREARTSRRDARTGAREVRT